MKFSVQILPRAETDYRAILSYIEERSPDRALRWRQAFHDAVHKLVLRAENYGLAPENEITEFEIRKILFKTPRGRKYRSVYTIAGRDVFILRIRGPGQRPLSADQLPFP